MPEIVPVSRTQERRPAESKLVCYSNNCPHYYVDSSAALTSINLGRRDAEAKVGSISLRDRNVVSVGYRKDGDPRKFIGLRPDATQHLGTEQLEFTPTSIRLDGDAIPFSLENPTTADAVTQNFGDLIYVKSTRQALRQLIRVPTSLSSFEAKWDVDTTGLTMQEKYGEFWFYTERGFFNRIRKPSVFTLDGKSVEVGGLQHSLENGIYRKWADELLIATDDDEVLIDADTYYSTTADGYVTTTGVDTWANVRAFTDGDASGTGSASFQSAMAASAGKGGFPIGRSLFYFPTSGATNPAAVDLMIYGVSASASDVSAQNGTQQAALDTSDFDSFDGTKYGDTNWATGAYNTIGFNAGGIAGINTSGETKICCRENTHDYMDSQPAAVFENGCYYADEAGTDKDPKLEITEGGGTPSGPPLGGLSLMGVGR